jgi:hypothetical protein
VAFDRVGCVRHLNKVEVGIDLEVRDPCCTSATVSRTFVQPSM